MPKRQRIAPTDNWQQLELHFTSPEQRTYALVRPVVLFGQAPADLHWTFAQRAPAMRFGRRLDRHSPFLFLYRLQTAMRTRTPTPQIAAHWCSSRPSDTTDSRMLAIRIWPSVVLGRSYRMLLATPMSRHATSRRATRRSDAGSP